MNAGVATYTLDEHIADLKEQSKDKGVTRFISTHPDQDHLHGIELLDAEMPIRNFYVVDNKATKSDETESFIVLIEVKGADFYLANNDS